VSCHAIVDIISVS